MVFEAYRKQNCFRNIGVIEAPLVQTWFLAVLSKGESHGYELINSLPTLIGNSDNQMVSEMGKHYRILRDLEEENFVSSKWDKSGKGPSKRIYMIKDSRIKELISAIQYAKQTKDLVYKFLTLTGREVK